MVAPFTLPLEILTVTPSTAHDKGRLVTSGTALHLSSSVNLRCGTPNHLAMYHSPVVQRSPTEENGRKRRDSMASSGVPPLPPYPARSPTQTHFHAYSPMNGNHQSSTYNAYSSCPSSSAVMQMPQTVNQSPRLGPPPSPTNGLSQLNRPTYPAREPGTSTYYDPTSEHRESSMAWAQSPYPGPSPIQVSEYDASILEQS